MIVLWGFKVAYQNKVSIIRSLRLFNAVIQTVRVGSSLIKPVRKTAVQGQRNAVQSLLNEKQALAGFATE